MSSQVVRIESGMKKLGLIAVFVMLAFSANSQDVWSLKTCMDSALTNNIAIRQLQYTQSLAEIEHAQSKYAFTPSISGGVGHSYNFGRNLDPISNEFTQTTRQNTSLNFSGSLLLFNGFSRYYALQKTELSLENQIFNEKIAVRNIKLEVLTLYLQCVLSQEVIQLAENHLDYTIGQEERMRLLVALETKTNNDLLEITAQKANDELTVIKAKNDLSLVLQELRRVMQINNQTGFRVDTVTSWMLSDTTIFTGVGEFAEVKQYNNVLRQADLDEKIARSAYFPTLSVRAGLGSGYSDSYFLTDPITGELYVPNFTTQVNENLYQSVSITLNVPIYNQHQTRTSVQLNQVATERAKLERDQLIWDLIGTIEQLQMDIKNAKAEMDAAAVSLEFAEEDFSQSQMRFENGLINYSELLNKKDRLYIAQSNLVQSKYNYYFKQKILTLYYE